MKLTFIIIKSQQNAEKQRIILQENILAFLLHSLLDCTKLFCISYTLLKKAALAADQYDIKSEHPEGSNVKYINQRGRNYKY
jgi:hypothetical protein